MAATRSFRFLDDGLNRDLIALLIADRVPHSLDRDGTIHYDSREQVRVENDLIGSIRGERFSTWQVVACPREWIARYRHYIKRRQIPAVEEICDGETSFLIPRSYRPHSWKLAEVARVDELAAQRT